MKTTNEFLHNRVIDILDKHYYLNKTTDGLYEIMLSVNDRDFVDAETIIELCQSSNPEQAFKEKIIEIYDEFLGLEVYELKKSLIQELNISDDISNELDELIEKLISWKYPIEYLLEKEYNVNIIVDTGDSNYDFTLNSKIYPHYNSNSESSISKESSLLWLIQRQGYNENQYKDIDFSKNNKFLFSCQEELKNMPSSMVPLTFLVKMTLRDILNLNKALNNKNKDGYIILDKSTTAGLYDFIGGGGSLFDIILEKDVKLPISFIHSILPDNDIISCYGFYDDVWGNSLKEIKL